LLDEPAAANAAADIKSNGGADMERELEVLVGDRRIATNEFARRIIISTLTGLLKPLRHVDTDEKIRITIGALKG
jgi:hypothetical protein